MKRFSAGLVLMLLCTFSIFAQNKVITVSGRVVESDTKEPAAQATVQLLSLPDSAYAAGIASSNQGWFTLPKVKAGKYVLKVSYIGFRTKLVPVQLSANATDKKLGTITLDPDAVMLKEAVITAEAPQVVVKEDTLEYNSTAYRTPEGAMQKVSSAKEQLLLLQNTASAEQKRFEVIEKALNVLRQERSQLLKGKSADEAEAVVAKREKELNLALEKARKEVEAVHNRLSGLQGEMKQITLAIGELQEQYKKIESPEQLPEIIKKQQEENLNIERTFSTMEARLLQQAKNKLTVEQIAKELAEKQTIAERWAKLNKLIGSADGAKFKVIAQSYTLNLLLLHANKHLSYLSKRYKLQQVPDTLALQVIDCDMCDEIRTVYSLSGGESFLISLALALGLSSLSSNNLKVESLFIDEGFGSLDAESLRTAMEALEQLQMQGRKIGVISHVQEMSERISVQVQVHKKVNGKSVLTVVG